MQTVLLCPTCDGALRMAAQLPDRKSADAAAAARAAAAAATVTAATAVGAAREVRAAAGACGN